MEPDARARMVREQLVARGITDARVLEAMGAVPREAFVPPDDRARAYDDRPLPLPHGQTISQPYVVALALELLALRPDDRLLEVGAGSGYAAAVAERLVAEVVAVERVGDLARGAAAVLERVGRGRVRVVAGDGARGVPGAGPFDAILVSCAAPDVPAALYDALVDGGRLVAPVGPPHEQVLQLVRRTPEGPVTVRSIPCRFVPLLPGEA